MAQEPALKIVREYIDYLQENRFEIRQAYLFGSFAKGKQNEDSDIDLAIVLRSLSNGFATRVELMKISRKFDTRIEPHPFDESDFNKTNPFANEILTNGVRIA